MRLRSMLALSFAAMALAACASLGEQEAASATYNSCRAAPDPAQCVRDNQARVEQAENREVMRQIQHRTKREDERVHYPDDESWSNH